jgi:drug/metabolite transporter (DMT)-like permease
VLFGGILGPVLLVWGLARTPAVTASLLLNLESVLTAALAWFAFREHFDRRIVLGMVLIFASGMLLAWQNGPRAADALGPLAVAGACLCWALDNNLTRKISASDAASLAAVKGLVAGGVNTGLGLAMGAALPPVAVVAVAGTVGLLGYGVSLVLFIVALRHLGASRTGAYIAAAPFVGAALALAFLGRATRPGVLARRCADGGRGLAASLGAARSFPRSRTDRAHASAHARRAPPACARAGIRRA